MTMTALGETARFVNGAAFKPSDWGSDGLPIIRIQNLTGTGESFNFTARETKAELVVEPGDLLVSWSATLDVYRWNGPRGLLNQHIFKVLPRAGIDPDYLFYALKNALAELSAKTHGSTMKHVVRGDFESTQVRIPALPEQRRIVDVLSRAESIVRLRREAQKKAAELIPALFLDTFGDPATNPKGWPTRPLSELVKFMGGGTPSKSRADFWVGELPWVSPKDMKRLEIFDAADHLSSKVLTDTNLKLIPPNSVLVVVRGMILAHSLPLAITRAPVTVNQDMKALTPIDQVVPDYLFWALMTSKPTLQAKIDAAAHGTKKLDTEHLLNLSVAVPPRAAQLAWTETAKAVTSIQTQQSTATTQAEATFNALLAQVFAPV